MGLGRMANQYKIGIFQLDKRERQITRNGEVVHLQPKSFDVLFYLLEHAGNLVTKQDVMDAVWRETIVTENSLAVCIRQIRAVLEDHAESPVYIETIAGSGYRFIGHCTPIVEQPESEIKRHPLWAGMVVLFFLVVVIYRYSTTNEEPFDWSKAYSVVVIPVEDVTRDSDTIAIATGLTDLIVEQLIPRTVHNIQESYGLTVSTSDATGDIASIARKHNAHHVLRTHIQKAADFIQIRAHLARSDGTNVWSETYTREYSGTDILSLQSEVSANIAHLVATRLGLDVLEVNALEHPQLGTATPQARENALKAWQQFVLLQSGTGGDFSIMRTFLEQSIEADAQFAFPHLLLGLWYMGSEGIISFEEAKEKAITHVERAIQLDPDDPRGLFKAAQIHSGMNLDYRRSQALLELVEDKRPDWVEVVEQMAFIALSEGRGNDVLKYYEAALSRQKNFERVNTVFYAAFYNFLIGNYEQSLRLSLEGLAIANAGEQEVDFSWLKVNSLIKLNKIDEVKVLLSESWSAFAHIKPEAYASAFAEIGDVSQAREILENKPSPILAVFFYRAMGFLSLGDHDAAMKAINTGIERRDVILLSSLRLGKIWDPLRCDPRFEQALAILAEMETLTEAGERAKVERERKGDGCERVDVAA